MVASDKPSEQQDLSEGDTCCVPHWIRAEALGFSGDEMPCGLINDECYRTLRFNNSDIMQRYTALID